MMGGISLFDAWSQTPAKGNQIGFVIATKGTASLLSKSAMPRPATIRQEVYPDDTIKTGLNSATKVLFDDQTMLSVTDNSEVGIRQYTSDIRAPKRNTILQMARGRAKAQVPEIYEAKDSRFEIRTPTAVAATRGADYVVWTYLQKGRVYTGVAVMAGTVEVTNPTGQSVTVAPGFFSVASTEAFLSTPAPIQRDPQVQQLVQEADVRTDPTVAPQVKLAQQQAPAPLVAGDEPEFGAQTPRIIPGEQWVRFGAGGISRTMGTTNTPCTIISGSGNLPLGCTVHPLR
jgi:hypothetical protein